MIEIRMFLSPIVLPVVALIGIVLACLVVSAPASALDLNPFSAIKSAVETAAEDRSAADIAKDLEVKAKVTAEVVDKMGSDVISINSDVYEQNVLLTGAVEKADLKTQAGELTAAIEGVKKVYNEILVIAPVDKEKGAVESFVDDSVIETKINALLLEASGVSVTNFRWRSIGGHVFLFGRALSQAEHAKATAVVKDIDKVQSVTNRATVRPKED
jgi:hyperosmotically inducible periplasmic protein